MDSSLIGSWPSNPSFTWRIQAIQANQIEEVFESGAGAVGPPWGPGTRAAFENPSTDR